MRNEAVMLTRTVWSVVRGEGVLSAFRRFAERVNEGLRTSRLVWRGRRRGPPRSRLLNVSPLPLSSRLGGLPIQLRARLDEECSSRVVNLLAPDLLEWSGTDGAARRQGPFRSTVALRDAAFDRSLQCALEAVGAEGVHIEGMAGVPIRSVLDAIDRGARVIVSAHDFALFCPRSDLIEQPSGSFCEYSVDEERCGRCLQTSWPVDDGLLAARRAAAKELLDRCERVVFPSEFLRERHRALFGTAGRSVVIEPGVVRAPRLPGQRVSLARAKGAPAAVAFVGSVTRRKGGDLIAGVIENCDVSGVQWHVFGGGDEALLRALRRIGGVTVHGYYRASRLPVLLERWKIGLAVLPSRCREAFGLTLSECWSAGVPAVAFAQGALQERISSSGGGWLVPAAEGAPGLAVRVKEWLEGRLAAAVPSPATAGDAAAAHLEMYREAGLAE